MKHGKKYKRLTKKSKLILLIVAFSVLLLATAGGVLAYLAVSTEPIPNTFVSSDVSCEVIVTDNVAGYSYSAVQIKNTGSIDGFIRVRLVPTWVDKNGETQGLPAWTPEVALNETDWKYQDGFYYYKHAVSPDTLTNNMLTAALVTSGDYRVDQNFADNDFRGKLEIYAEIIQSSPTTAVYEAWGVIPTEL